MGNVFCFFTYDSFIRKDKKVANKNIISFSLNVFSVKPAKNIVNKKTYLM
jgi:hypothetical protein